ncbi:glycosyl transferase family 2 [Caballeronia insecticola]|uniref:Glycosyl transferase family 2 n=1 Tax=Caballeronia insecticola TaxID=758793 RepID=R4X0I8_9BURK|nr:glycosyl transferase family 2 [Caballeronia insecticola]
MDDGSTDGSQDIAARYAAQFSKVKCLSLGRNAGAARARNWGAMHADYDVLAFLDADDEYLPGALHTAAVYLVTYPNEASVRLNIEFCGFPERIATHPDFDRLGGLLVGTVPSSLVIRRSIFLALGGFPCDEIFRTAGGEDMPLSKALFELFGNTRLTGTRHVRMHYHPRIHAERFFLINMGFITDPEPQTTAAVMSAQMHAVRRAAAAIEELARLRNTRVKAA